MNFGGLRLKCSHNKALEDLNRKCGTANKKSEFQAWNDNHIESVYLQSFHEIRVEKKNFSMYNCYRKELPETVSWMFFD